MNLTEYYDFLTSYKLKDTNLRKKIYNIFNAKKDPIDAIELTQKIKVNKTSIYREIKRLLELGFIKEVEFGDGKKRYEATFLTHHHHLVCTKCGDVKDVELEKDLFEDEKYITKKYSFLIQRHNLEFFGVCKKCL